MKILIKNGTIVTQNKKRDVFQGSLLIENNKIISVSKKDFEYSGIDSVIDASGKFVIPGIIQTHVHLCQALFRGRADDLSLLQWLKKRIWPMESNHTYQSLSLSAKLGLLELQLSGTTSILDMGTVEHAGALFDAAKISGIRYWGGNCLMDIKNFSGPLYKKTSDAIKDCEQFAKAFHSPDENMNYVYSPRFVVCCTKEILEFCQHHQKASKNLVHIHASESKEEIKIVKQRTRKDNVDYLDSLGLLNPRTVVVHGVHLTKKEIKKMIQTKTPLAHCPSANLKLASGFAPIQDYVSKGMTVSIGTDGAACNNTMDPFIEMRLAALIQKPFFGPEALTAREAFDLGTLGGAKTLGMEKYLGSLEEGKLADIVTIDRSHPSVHTVEDPYSALVYSCLGRDVNDVIINGKVIVRNKEHQTLDAEKILHEGNNAAAEI